MHSGGVLCKRTGGPVYTIVTFLDPHTMVPHALIFAHHCLEVYTLYHCDISRSTHYGATCIDLCTSLPRGIHEVYTRSPRGLHEVYTRSTRGLHEVYITGHHCSFLHRFHWCMLKARQRLQRHLLNEFPSTPGLHEVYKRST